uniref:Uncharacterized protein n=1 Tax=Octopus bimaculoides TaxID=37653 RepID=A0A0L8HGI7_OCTBM
MGSCGSHVFFNTSKNIVMYVKWKDFNQNREFGYQDLLYRSHQKEGLIIMVSLSFAERFKSQPESTDIIAFAKGIVFTQCLKG